MNSSLLVPALVVVAVTAGVFVFGDGLFSSGSSGEVSKYSVSKSTKAIKTADVSKVKAASSMEDDFSWDDDAEERSPVQRPTESFVSTKQTEEASGGLYGSGFGDLADDVFDSSGDFAAADFGAGDSSADADVDGSAFGLNEKTASKPVDDDLSDIFGDSSKATESDPSSVRSSSHQSVQAPTTTVDSGALSDLDVALASPKSSDSSVDAFDDFGSTPSDFNPARRTNGNAEMKSVVKSTAPKSTAQNSEVATSDAAPADATSSSVIAGALEPVKDGHASAVSGLSNGGSGKMPLRKFKITNPKETTLAVTLSVDGKQVTLKPDQSFVLQQTEGDVEVIFSRGGSFGFETKTLKNGHYRFTVSREAGWQLLN